MRRFLWYIQSKLRPQKVHAMIESARRRDDAQCRFASQVEQQGRGLARAEKRTCEAEQLVGAGARRS